MKQFAGRALLISLGVQALIVLPVNVGANPITFGPFTTDVTDTGTLPGEPCTALGQQLLSATITASAAAQGQYGLENISLTSTSTVTVTQELKQISVSVPGLPGGAAVLSSSNGPLVFGPVVLTVFDGTIDFGGTSGVTVDPTFNQAFGPVNRVFNAPADLAFFSVPTFNVNFLGDADDRCDFSSGNSVCNITTIVSGQASVAYTCQTVPSLVCDDKSLSPDASVLNTGTGTATASFRIRNDGSQAFVNNVNYIDQMNAKMVYQAGSGTIGDPIGPVGAPPTYTWPNQSLAVGAFVDVGYAVNVNGLAVGETICNTVVAEAPGITTSNTCQACITRRETPTVPAISPLGLAFLTFSVAGIAGWWLRQRRQA
jgi:hypothetical protein